MENQPGHLQQGPNKPSPKLPHQKIVAYLRGDLDKKSKGQIHTVKQEDPVYGLLFTLIDQLKDKAIIKRQPKAKSRCLRFHEIDAFLMRAFSDTTEPSDAQTFIDGLLYSPLFYQRLLIKLARVTPEMALNEIPEMAQIQVRSDEEILSRIVSQVKDDEPSAEIEPYSKPSRIWDKIRDFPSLPKLVPRLPYALAALVFVTLGVFWGVRFYNTSYRIHKAENLLTENYRIYMEDTPRLSGGYASTGIGMLMSGDEPSSYLTQALDYTEEAIDSGSKSSKAKQLQAQVFIIQKQYDEADSVMKLIDAKARNSASVLNDIGVLEFSQENWEGAAQHFESAIHANPHFSEAYYNLALAQDKLGKKQDAISTLEKYLGFENDEGWKSAALSFLNNLKE